MTFVDANYFLRYVVEPTPGTMAMHAIAAALFEAVERGEEDASTSEAVVAEVAYVLNSKRHYGLPPADIAAVLSPILELPNLTLPPGRKELYLRALDLWMERPKLGFVDALTVAELEQTGIPLATFDRDFDALPGITRRSPPQDESD
jgi:predicted nucleic acid-binding protein